MEEALWADAENVVRYLVGLLTNLRQSEKFLCTTTDL